MRQKWEAAYRMVHAVLSLPSMIALEIGLGPMCLLLRIAQPCSFSHLLWQMLGKDADVSSHSLPRPRPPNIHKLIDRSRNTNWAMEAPQEHGNRNPGTLQLRQSG